MRVPPLLSFLLLAAASLALAALRPVPRVQALPLPRDEVSFQVDGREVTRLYTDLEAKRPYLYPVLGAAGRSLTRMGHPRDPDSHSHHNSVWISHDAVGGANFWGDKGPSRIRRVRWVSFEDSDTAAKATMDLAWEAEPGRVLLHERRRVTVTALPEAEWLLTIESRFSVPAGQPAVTLGASGFGMLGVRMAKSLGVHDGGGTIRNSAGGVNEKGCFRKPTRWVDYSGAIAPGVLEGITLMDHPSNPGHPVPFHVRDDGWMCASTTLGAALVIAPETPLELRYRLYVHRGMPSPEALQARWQEFAEAPAAPWPR